MGNVNSDEEKEDQILQGSVGEDSGVNGDNLLDFSSLFQPDALYKALLTIKQPSGSAVSKNKDGLVRWLSGLADTDEHTVNMVQVVEYLTSKGVSKEEALEFFSEVDRDGEGQVDIAYLLMILKERAVDPMQALVPCNMLPGPLEVYLPDKGSYSEAGRKLVQFLQTRRVEPTCLGVGWMNQILAYQLTREKLVQGRYQMRQQAEEEEEEEDDCGVMERQVISKCYSKIDTSTSQNQIKHLTDNRTDTYWQSNGSPRSHWIRLCMLPGITMREVAVSVDSSDDSYMPHTIVVSVGNTEKQLTEIKTVYVPRDRTGQVVLVKNLGRIYRYIQINIRSCHSDGCDVKIRGLHVKGSKVQELKQPSVLDTMTMWYISILASTAKAAIPVAPQLRDSIISQSRLYLESLQPLVLSPSSSVRPEFLSSFVIQEMGNMLKSLSLPEETYVSVPAECLEILLTFSIAHGSVNSILDCLHILLDNQNVELNVHNLLLKMENVKNSKHLNHAEAIQFNVASCNGGCKDDNHKVDNIIKNAISNTSATPYISSASYKAVTVVLREKNDLIFSPTRLVVQVPSTDNAASFCLFFLLDDEPKKEWLEQLISHEGWGQEEYSKWLEETKGKDDSGLIAVAQFSKEKLQMDISPDVLKSGQSLVLVLCASGEGVEGVALQAISVFGHCITDNLQQSTSFLQRLDTVAPLPPKGSVIGGVVLCRVLVFLSTLLQDLSKLMEYRRMSSMDPTLIPEPHLAVEGLSLEKIWNLFIPLTLTPDGQADYAALLTLWLLRSALPFIKPDKKAVTTSSQKSDGDPLKVSSAVLSHLCALLDADEEAGDQSVVQRLAEDIVVKGVVVFFPDATARKEYLLSMIESVLNEKQPRSWWLKFEALCQYFSNTDANSLLGLPKKIKEGEIPETGRALDLLSTVLTVATRESQMSLFSGKSRPDDLVRLLCALQASLFFWCRRNVNEANAQHLLLSYVDKLVTESRKILKAITGIERDKEEKMKALQKSLLSRTLAEMLVFLPTIAESPVSRPRLMDILYPLVPALHTATSSSPSIFLRLSEAGSIEDHKESVVGVWTRESSHNYENNARVTEEFVCPLATKFVVEFDSRCITERRYDYLEFIDVHGIKHRFDGKVNSDRWSQTAEFPGPKLQFIFHSDGSNNEWGYLFTMKAYGQPAPSLHWLFDLQLSVARLFGQLISTTLSMKTLYPHLPDQQSEEQREEALLTRSDLWKTLFRGGYMVGKLTRSLSGAHTASPADSSLNMLLQDMVKGQDGRGKVLLDSLREKLKAPYYGGELVDRAVNSVFAALVWHCQDLREELAPQLALSESLHPSQLLQDAFSTAEALRRELVEARQKIVKAKEKEENQEKRSKMNEDTPLITCHEKAVFLLKFAGLSRVAQEEGEEGLDEVDGNPTLSPSWPRRSSQHWQKVSNAISTVGRLKQQLSLGGQVKPRKKPLSFELVLTFVKNESATVDKVHRLLKEREKVASCVAQAYTSAATYLSALSIDNMFELPGLVFLQQLISKQRYFPNHYAAKLDGCGLELENQVRRAYHMLLKRLLEGLSAFSRPPSGMYSRARLLVSIITCHLLDFQWQEYDHRLLADIQLPDFLLQSAITSTHSEEKEHVEMFKDEEAMLTRYSLHMALREAMGDRNLATMEELELYRDNKWEGDLFISAIAREVSQQVTVQCDGCEKLIENGVFYHNMDLKTTSYDLCPVCFKSGSGSRPEDHKSDQLYQALGSYYCDICKLCILSHRFHSNTRQNFDLCLGCFRKEEVKGCTDSWSVFLLTEVSSTDLANHYMTSDPKHSKPLLYQDGYITRVGPALDLMVYQQQHCWILFTALCLSMAHFLNTKHTSAHEQDYKSQACHNHLQCLKHMSAILRTAVLAKWEEQEKKVVEKKKGEDDVKVSQKREREVMSINEQDTVHELPPTSTETTPIANEAIPTSTETTPNANEATPAETVAPDAPLHEEEDPIALASRLHWRKHSNTTSMEKTFSSLNISRTLYTLSAVLPQDMSLSVWQEGGGEVDTCLAEELLPALLEVATCTPIQPLPRQLAYLVSAQYMARVNPEVADRAIHIARRLSPDQPVRNVDSTEGHGLVTAKYFFSLGAGFLHKSDFGGAATIAECLLVLSKSTQWKEAVSLSVFSPLHTRAEEMDLSSIFGLMVLAGFPKLHREGSLVQLHSSGSDPHQQPLSVLTSVEGESGSVVSSKHRDPKTVKLSQCEVEDTLQGCITSSQISSLFPLLQQSMQLAKQEDARQVEATWILVLALKALLALLKGVESNEVVKALMKEDMLPSITRLACRATRLQQRWLASDLEVVAIQGYQPLLPGKKADVTEGNHESREMTDGPEEGEGEKKREEKGEESKEEEKEKEVSRRSEEACLEGLSVEIQDMLVIMQEAFQCPLTTLRALFDASGADVNQFIMSSEQYYDMESATLKPPDDIVEAAKKWEAEQASAQHEVKDIQDSLEDTGVTRLVPVPFSPSSLEAEPEKDDVMKRPKSFHLMQEDSTHQLQDKESTCCKDSFQLLQEKIKEGVISRKQLLKIQQAIVVLYARHVLAAVLSHWPSSPHPLFSTSLLGNLDIMQFFCLLDLLMKPLNNQACSDLMEVLVSCTEPTQIVSLAVTASECMRKVTVGMEKKQFHHPATGTLEEKGTVVIANASSMSVVFHQTKGEVELSSKDDFSDHHKSLSHSETNTQFEVTHLIPGNTVCYKVALKSVKEAKYPPCTLTITGTQMGRFTTGLKFLERLFKLAGEGGNDLLSKSIPLSKLWCNLIAVACQQTGHERLKVIHLLLQLLTMMKDSALLERPDLSLLKPLWQLYTTLMKDYDAKNRSQQLLAPEIVRALTELFLAVENQAEEWGVSQIMMIETLTKEGLGTWLEKGISNVAFLSLGLGLDNTAARAFIEAKRSYVPPVEEEKEEEEEEEEEDIDHGSSSDDGSSSSSVSDSFDSES